MLSPQLLLLIPFTLDPLLLLIQPRFDGSHSVMPKQKKARHFRVELNFCGPYWIRTSDPLLVRQVL